MKRSIKILSVLMAIVMVGVLFTGCAAKDKKEIRSLMTEFEASCNSLDAEAILNCVTPRVADKLKLGLGIFGMVAETDAYEYLSEILYEYIGDASVNGEDFFSTIKIEVQDITLDEKTAVVNTIVSYGAAGEELVREATFGCEYYAERWYISSFELL